MVSLCTSTITLVPRMLWLVSHQDGCSQTSVRHRPADYWNARQFRDNIIWNWYLTCTLVNCDSNRTPTYEIVQLLGETSHHLREVDSQSTVCTIQYAPKIYSGECRLPAFEIKEEQLSFLIDQGFQVPVIAQLFRVSTRTIEGRMTKYDLTISGRL